MSSVVEVVMNEEVKVVALKSNKRRLNFLLSKILELQGELKSLEASEEAFEASRSRNVTKRSKGRPQAKKDQETEVDLFANLVKEVVSVAEGDAVVSSEEAVVEKPVTKKEKVSKPLKHVLSEEEKAAKKAELDKAKAEEKLLKKAQLAEEKLAKAEEKKLQLAAEKQEKIDMAAADKESKKAQLAEDKALKKQALLAEKNAKKQALLAEKEAKKQAKAPKAAPKKATSPKEEAVVTEVEAPVEKVTVSRITINDIKYLKSSTNILYNPETREEVGLYDPETRTIKPLPDDEEEEMTEDAYESDNE